MSDSSKSSSGRRPRRQFTPEFKAEAVQMVRDSGGNIAQAAIRALCEAKQDVRVVAQKCPARLVSVVGRGSRRHVRFQACAHDNIPQCVFC